ncbi:unnamed protein product [Fusarium venenatum]|uniref:Uncharacterized protein n=1 Tax=Fusarium venenatum TaxID=56646 RepID=A0A2L2TRP7_9HYPO|nr:uncharacterized protein FVRRES_06861 [Fusarium venenatum]CEI62425.1 unnamed protein product [Fusarium venenatum]
MPPPILFSPWGQAVSTAKRIASSVNSFITRDTNTTEIQVEDQAGAQLFVVLRLIGSDRCPLWSFCIYNPSNHAWKTYESWKGCDQANDSVLTAHVPHTARKGDCSQQYVRNAVRNLVKARFLKMCQAKEVFDKIDNCFGGDELPPHIGQKPCVN